MSEKIADLTQELGTEIDKIKIIQSLSKELSMVDGGKINFVEEKNLEEKKMPRMTEDKYGQNQG